MVGHDDVNCYCLQNKGPIVHGPPEPLYATPDLDTHIAHGVPGTNIYKVFFISLMVVNSLSNVFF